MMPELGQTSLSNNKNGIFSVSVNFLFLPLDYCLGNDRMKTDFSIRSCTRLFKNVTDIRPTSPRTLLYLEMWFISMFNLQIVYNTISIGQMLQLVSSITTSALLICRLLLSTCV